MFKIEGNRLVKKEEIEIFSQLCNIIEESEQISLDVMNHLDIVLKLVCDRNVYKG